MLYDEIKPHSTTSGLPNDGTLIIEHDSRGFARMNSRERKKTEAIRVDDFRLLKGLKGINDRKVMPWILLMMKMEKFDNYNLL